MCHSPNLGDRVIAECMGHALRRMQPGATVEHVDISGRDAPGAETFRNRQLMLAVADRLPRPVRHRLARWKMGRHLDRLEDRWRAAARDADLIVIGGGQILADANLNFPLKLNRVARIATETGAPVVIHAAGVARNWTPEGRRLFTALQGCNLRRVALRDTMSVSAWRDQMPHGGPAPVLTADPGLLAAACYGTAPVHPGRVGLCVTDFGLLAHHADGPVAGSASGAAFYAATAARLAKVGHEVILFTNGATEDEALLHRVGQMPECADAGVIVAARAETAAELSELIAGCETVVAHRLHACILAIAHGRGAVGLGWDSKLRAFFDSIGASRHFVDAPDLAAEDMLHRVAQANRAQALSSAREQAIASAWQGIRQMLDTAGERRAA